MSYCEAGDRVERELVVLDPVLLADLERVHAEVRGQVVHHPLDRERRLGTAGAAVGVGPGAVGEDGLAVELVGGELVDAVVHEGAQHRRAAAEQGDVRAEVAVQMDLQAGDGAVLLGGEGDVLDLGPAVVAALQALAARLGVLDRLADLTRDGEGDPLLGRDRQLAAEPAAHVWGDHADLRLRAHRWWRPART